MGDVELAGGWLAPDPPLEVGRIVAGHFTGHQGGGARIHAQGQNRLLGFRARHRELAVAGVLDQVGVVRITMLGTVALERAEPGLLHELEKAGGRRAWGMGGRIVAALARSGAHQEAEIGPCGFRGALDRGADCLFYRLDGHVLTVVGYG